MEEETDTALPIAVNENQIEQSHDSVHSQREETDITETKEAVGELVLDAVTSSSEENLDTVLHTLEEFVGPQTESSPDFDDEISKNVQQNPVSEDHRDSGLCELIVQCDSRDETYMMYTSEDEYLSPNSESGGYHTPTITLQDEVGRDLGKSTSYFLHRYYRNVWAIRQSHWSLTRDFSLFFVILKLVHVCMLFYILKYRKRTIYDNLLYNLSRYISCNLLCSYHLD